MVGNVVIPLGHRYSAVFLQTVKVREYCVQVRVTVICMLDVTLQRLYVMYAEDVEVHQTALVILAVLMVAVQMMVKVFVLVHLLILIQANGFVPEVPKWSGKNVVLLPYIIF